MSYEDAKLYEGERELNLQLQHRIRQIRKELADTTRELELVYAQLNRAQLQITELVNEKRAKEAQDIAESELVDRYVRGST